MRKFLSRKLLVAAGSTLVVVLTHMGLPEDIAVEITNAVVLIAGIFLGVQGLDDLVKEWKSK